MSSLIPPEAVIQSGDIGWCPWEESREIPFTATKAVGPAWVKTLSKYPESGAESVTYQFDPGWSAEGIENTEETAAVNALREGRDPHLPKHWQPQNTR